MQSPLLKRIDELEQFKTHIDTLNTSVSASSVGWHLDHSLKVIIYICRMIKVSNPDEYAWKLNGLRTLVFMMGDFPRGRAKAPASTIAKEDISIDDINNQLDQAKQLLDEIKDCSPLSHFEHFIFGKLNLKKSHGFMVIHTRHHIKIMRDIINS